MQVTCYSHGMCTAINLVVAGMAIFGVVALLAFDIILVRRMDREMQERHEKLLEFVKKNVR